MLDGKHPNLATLSSDCWMDGYIFVAGKGAIDQVMVAGQSVVTNGRHHKREPISARYARTLARILT